MSNVTTGNAPILDPRELWHLEQVDNGAACTVTHYTAAAWNFAAGPLPALLDTVPFGLSSPLQVTGPEVIAPINAPPAGVVPFGGVEMTFYNISVPVPPIQNGVYRVRGDVDGRPAYGDAYFANNAAQRTGIIPLVTVGPGACNLLTGIIVGNSIGAGAVGINTVEVSLNGGVFQLLTIPTFPVASGIGSVGGVISTPLAFFSNYRDGPNQLEFRTTLSDGQQLRNYVTMYVDGGAPRSGCREVYRYKDELGATVEWRNLDGTPYTPLGSEEIGPCPERRQDGDLIHWCENGVCREGVLVLSFDRSGDYTMRAFGTDGIEVYPLPSWSAGACSDGEREAYSARGIGTACTLPVMGRGAAVGFRPVGYAPAGALESVVANTIPIGAVSARLYTGALTNPVEGVMTNTPAGGYDNNNRPLVGGLGNGVIRVAATVDGFPVFGEAFRGPGGVATTHIRSITTGACGIVTPNLSGNSSPDATIIDIQVSLNGGNPVQYPIVGGYPIVAAFGGTVATTFPNNVVNGLNYLDVFTYLSNGVVLRSRGLFNVTSGGQTYNSTCSTVYRTLNCTGGQAWVNVDGTAYVPNGSETPGPCIELGSVISGGAMIAGATIAATAPFLGAVQAWSSEFAPITELTSITVTVTGVTNGLPGLTADQVIVTTSDGSQISLLNGETKTWSVARDRDGKLRGPIRFSATGNAIATIHYTGV